MFVIKFKKFFIALSAIFVVASIASTIVFGLNMGIDFKGGSALAVHYKNRPEVQVIGAALSQQGFKDAVVQPVNTGDVSIKTHSITDTERAHILDILSLNHTYEVSQLSFTTIGPTVGSELARKSILAIVCVLIAIICFVAYAFRKVSRPVSSWKFGLAVIIALFHDIMIPVGVMAIFGHYFGAEVDTLFVVALLTTLGLSVSDTIVVFDRIREHLSHNKADTSEKFEHLVGESLSETFARSINTSLVVLIMVVTLAVFGPASTKLFATILAIGMFFGTYSSIFLASPLLVVMEKLQSKKK
jgi:preprotein translocase subunit SecF